MKTDFEKIKNEIEKYDEKREQLIKNSLGFIKKTKIIIYSLNRGEKQEAGTLRQNLESEFNSIKDSIKDFPAFNYSGIYKSIVQEYVEAMTYYHFIDTGELLGYSELNVEPEHYLLGLCDLTGELVRRAINAVIKKDFKSAEKIKDFVSSLYGEFLKINLRNGELRKKFDEIKYNLKKLEDLVADISLKTL